MLGGAARRAQGPLVLLVPRCSTWSRLVPLLPLLPLVHLVLPCPAWSHLLPLVHLVLLVLPCPAWSHLVCLAPLCADAQALCGLSPNGLGWGALVWCVTCSVLTC